MFGAIFRFLVTWIPFLGRFFPDYIPDTNEKRKSDLPQARIAIIGAGVGGCCASYFLRELGGDNLDIHVWQKKGVPVGGRTAVIDFAGHVYESGGSIIHTSNKYLVDFAEQFGLETKGDKDEATTPVGIYNGKTFCFRTGVWGFWNTIKSLWHFGISLIKMDFLVRSTLKKFSTIYNIQANGQAFPTVQEMLTAMGGTEMFELTQVSAGEYLTGGLGWSEKVVEELVTPALYVNYGQNSTVDTFTTLVALAGMEDGSLWSVVGGNKQIPEKLLQASGATYQMGEVLSVTRVENSGKISYIIETDSEGGSQDEFDVVIIANPLNTSAVRFENFPVPIYTAAATSPYQRTVATFVKGEVNPAFFGLSTYGRDFPQTILTTDMEGSPFEFRSVATEIPSEVPGNQVKQYQKPICEDPMRVWKVFSPLPLTDEQIDQMFTTVEDRAVVDWLAYPVYNPPEDCPPFILDDGVFYINGIEKAASAMEMSAIGAKNVALLAKDYLLKNQ